MSINVEKSQLSDIDELEMLYNDICDYLATKDYNPGWRKGCFPTRSEALHFMQNDTLYVAKLNEKIVGSIALTHNSNGETNVNCQFNGTENYDILFIHVFVVHPDYLRKGIGTAILDFAEEVG